MNKNIQPTEQSLQAFANNSNVITLKSFIAANDFKSDMRREVKVANLLVAIAYHEEIIAPLLHTVESWAKKEYLQIHADNIKELESYN